MAEFRHDPVHRRWIIATVDRSRGPQDFQVPARAPDEGFCPFCAGQESKTPPEIYALRSSSHDRPGWQVRVFPNKYPALSSDEREIRRGAHGIYDWINGIGAHEIVVEHPQHHVLFHQFSVEHMAEVVRAWRIRLAALMDDHRFRYVMVFKNNGATSGASVNHQHSQIIAMPIIPRIAAMALATAREHFHHKERCLFCDLVDQELADGRRVVARNEHFFCYVPYASRFPFEMLILPLAHQHDFSLLPDELVPPLAQILSETMRRLATLFGDLPFNLTIHTAPNTDQSPRRSGYWSTISFDWHWQVEIIPRLSPVHGFEWGTGLFINPTPAEEAARYLRDAVI